MPTLLFVTTSKVAERRIENAACAVARAHGGRLPLLITYEALVESAPRRFLGEVWRQPGVQRRRDWLTGSVEQALAAGTAASR
jgi:hypothetical protein